MKRRGKDDEEEELVGRPLKTKEQEGEPRGQSRAVCSADSRKWKVYTTSVIGCTA